MRAGFDWTRHDRALARWDRAVDTVIVALGSGGAVSLLVDSLKVWLTQPRRSDIRLVIQREQDQKIEIDAQRVAREDVEGLLREAL
ncbi:effector-associated constant component EACC1 [Actinomadura mexicana]|uniref:Uncharacterized protein n=1 Tax=Actinomadura mexicana TaxID=134959 RepID=A0A238UPN2_9ACTN|nr:hypothetical protein [Actinomadura mexicana]SNR23901.1 hypothetical protein SAMN06265355_101232 [Actinomadura mexicana]